MPALLSVLGLGSPKNQSVHYLADTNPQNLDTLVEQVDIMANAKITKAQMVALTILDTHEQLKKLSNYRPGKEINRLLGNLVHTCVQIHPPSVIQQILNFPGLQQMLPSLRTICSEAECCLENHWAEHALSFANQGSDAVLKALQIDFPYFHNYVDLARLELSAIRAAMPTTELKKITFIGSGPLPLTSWCLLDEIRQTSDNTPTITNIDMSPSAIATSLHLNAVLGPWGEEMEFFCGEAGSSSISLADSDVVYVAALVGLSQEDKEEIFLNVVRTMRPGALLVIRSAWGLRTCLYPEVSVNTERLLEVLEPCAVVHPYTDVVNSVVVARVRE
ncbi:Nicotianamine synthase [Neurospora tetraspora]|uniref:Nicotianamine synthase n=1 Tax=Neurospora tetraspora TaxID=94610 RepID=A0AAE0JMC3_9PEZI|nr:Nicotianamine synthase [Neurospora tetraspora]